MDDPKALAAQRWFGYGRWDASYWFIGMEPGGTDDHASYEVWMQLGGTELIDCRAHHRGSNFSKWHRGNRPPTQPTWRRLIQLLLGYEGKPSDSDSVSIYQRDKWGATDGDTTLLEVSALHAESLSALVNRDAYRDHRIATLRERLETHHPKFVVFYGLGYSDIYEKIANARFDANGYAWHAATLCALVVGPTGRNIPTEMKSPEWWVKKGREMQTIAEGGAAGLEQDPTIPLPDTRTERARQQRPPITGRGSGGREPELDREAEAVPSDVIRLLRNENPKKLGSKSRLRFACYRDGMTVAQYVDAVRVRLGSDQAKGCLLDLQWDSDPKRSFIRIERGGRPIALRRTASMSYDRIRP